MCKQARPEPQGGPQILLPPDRLRETGEARDGDAHGARTPRAQRLGPLEPPVRSRAGQSRVTGENRSGDTFPGSPARTSPEACAGPRAASGQHTPPLRAVARWAGSALRLTEEASSGGRQAQPQPRASWGTVAPRTGDPPRPPRWARWAGAGAPSPTGLASAAGCQAPRCLTQQEDRSPPSEDDSGATQ